MTEYRIDMESTRLPVDDNEWAERLERFVTALEQDPRALGAIGAGTIGHLGTVFIVEAERFGEAMSLADAIFEDALKVSAGDLGDVESERMLIEPADYEPLQLVGATDAAKILGVTRQRLYQLQELYDDFPKPLSVPKRGAVWDRRAIAAWAEKDRPAGRPLLAGIGTVDNPAIVVDENVVELRTPAKPRSYSSGRRKVAARKPAARRRGGV